MAAASVFPTPHAAARILVVDDEQLLAWTLGKVLSSAGYDVVTFNNPLLVLDEVCERPVDLVISDVVMPEMSGVDLAIRLRQQRPESKILLLSGQANTIQMLGEARTLGFDFEMFAKPIAPAELLRVVAMRIGTSAT